ncbi:GRIP and coiled-coil domain-containing protein 1 [Myotis brandtii]|uniref:GRIP and coiled-coil domain-containing protein 1 n=1 Tax=Myotis brandtii TaxID=109478 RepID=S7PTY3_MYOBR|nr:GRIP and coiled-coil domain-containing protein 1 [Myotis brandtii]
MKQDLEDASKKAEEERERLEGELKELQEQIAETKARLITQQHDRAQEQSDHALMLRELQKLLQEERTQRQDLELRLEEAREALAGQAYAAGQMEGFELQAKQLTREVEELQGELQALRDEKNRPDPRLQELQEEAACLKSHFQAQLQQEMRKWLYFQFLMLLEKFYLRVPWEFLFCVVLTVSTECASNRMWSLRVSAGLEPDSSEFLGIGILPAVLCEAYRSSCAMKGPAYRPGELQFFKSQFSCHFLLDLFPASCGQSCIGL